MIQIQQPTADNPGINGGLKLLLEKLPFGIVLSCRDKLFYANGALLRSLGQDDDDGRDSEFLQRLLPEWPTLLEAHASGQSEPHEGLTAHRCAGLRKDGSAFEFSIEFANIDFLGVTAAFVTDITKPMQNGQPTVRPIEEIAHDLNNLLTLIEVHASTLLTDKVLDKELADSAHQIYRAVDQAAGLTCQLLTPSRVG
ncbi:MAG: hypothetical protein FJ403_04475 [Verrucomicrobia bacterium]|nr:hypothetical protein [Verrucomicrobiota bacterium]